MSFTSKMVLEALWVPDIGANIALKGLARLSYAQLRTNIINHAVQETGVAALMASSRLRFSTRYNWTPVAPAPTQAISDG